MAFKMCLALLMLCKSCIASTNNEDSTSFVQRELASVSNLSNVTKLYQSTVSGNSTTVTPAPTAAAQCRSADGNFNIDGKGYLFPYLDGKLECFGVENYCIAECRAVYKENFDQCNPSVADTQGCNLDHDTLLALFIDFDGTIELYDDLADHVNELLPQEVGLNVTEYDEKKKRDPQGTEPTNQVTGAKMIAALDKVFNDKCNGDTATFKKKYFENPAGTRLEDLRKSLKFFLEANVSVYVMSASWAPISAAAWEEYLKHLTSEAKYGLELRDLFTKIVTVSDPGGDTPGNKAVAIASIMADMGKTMEAAVHIDNSYKYAQQVVHGERMIGKAGAGKAGAVCPSMNRTEQRGGVQCSHFKLIAEQRRVPNFPGCGR